jgi:hypothetical protein
LRAGILSTTPLVTQMLIILRKLMAAEYFLYYFKNAYEIKFAGAKEVKGSGDDALLVGTSRRSVQIPVHHLWCDIRRT